MALKSILKKPAHAPETQLPPTASTPNDRHLEIALHHARRIQQQKDVETQILEALEELLDLPHAANADPVLPAESDVQLFKTLITPFQPSDYDSLIEERHAADLCGYALCPRPPKKDKSAGKFRIKVTGKDVNFIPKEKLEQFCSDDCARRAMYVKVQLNEEPAWVRRAGAGAELKLMGEAATTFSLPIRPRAEEADLTENMAQLALERGNKPLDPSGNLITPTVVEKNPAGPVDPPRLDNGMETPQGEIEGYAPKKDRNMPSNLGDEEIDDKDWDIF